MRKDAKGALPAGPLGRRPRVLIVKNNVDAADMAAMYLLGLGYEAIASHGAVDALAQASALRPDIVVLDLALHGMDGSQLAAQLRQLDGTKDAAFIALSSYEQPVESKAWFDAHLVNLVDLDQLLSVIRRLAEKSPALA